MRIFIKQCPWDQYLQQRWGGSRNGQGKKLCCEEGLPATLADFMGKLWSHNDPLELSGAFMLWHQSVVYVGHEKGYGGLRQECTFPETHAKVDHQKYLQIRRGHGYTERHLIKRNLGEAGNHQVIEATQGRKDRRPAKSPNNISACHWCL
ncbi:cAMP-dependent protein kinase inhibitor beta isoform X3 [Felis catus]|uniref:cAMP-dependent protein kinase inhibitor beta isoform X3 n=1 Tax=Felis catus TaxID=9685 RepID=UPI001D19B155|nr:cAMP-dependent protein kinase inhibitor beta isoform X3 [Felis catus]